MLFINSLILAFSSSIDSFGIGITYGIKNTKISPKGKFVLFFVSFIVSIISIWCASLIKNILPVSLTKCLASFIIISMGIFICFQAFKKDKNSICNTNSDNKFDINYCSEEKIYSFFIKFLGITVKIIKNPNYSDFDNSNSIDSKEALFLGLALSLDSFCIGISASILDFTSILFPLFISIFQLLFINLGNYVGRKLHGFNKIPDNLWSIISGILLILIGLYKFF